MTWSNGKPTIICEECGHEAMPEEFTWFDGELAICKDVFACAKRKSKLPVTLMYMCESCGESQTRDNVTFTHVQPVLECRDHISCRERQQNRKGSPNG